MKIKPFLTLAFAVLFSATANAQQNSLLDKVNLYMGTADDFGQMTPGATVPYGQIQVCPDSKPRQHPGYDFEVPTISGFSINRLSGVGGSGCGGNVSLMPDATGQDVRLLKHTEQAYPGYYSVQLSNGVWFTATANYRIAAERFSFPSKEKAVLLLNPPSTRSSVQTLSRRRPTWGKASQIVQIPVAEDITSCTTDSTQAHLSYSTRLPTVANASLSLSYQLSMWRCASSFLLV